MKIITPSLRWLGGACYSLATKLDPPPVVAPEPVRTDIERARELVAMMAAARAEVDRQLAEEQSAHDACVDLAEVREQRAADQRRDSDVLTFTRGQLRRACVGVLTNALERELARRFRLRLVTNQ